MNENSTKAVLPSLALVAATLLLVACPGGAAKPAATTPDDDDFACKERRAEYTIVGGWMSHQSGLVEPEAGVVVSCVGGKTRIEKWRLFESGRKTSTHSLTSDEFNTFWQELESAGWRNLSDCNNPSAAPDDPVYGFMIGDENLSQQLTCPGKELPFPFDRLRNSFDLIAARYDD